MSQPPSPAMTDTVHRPSSIRSVASNSSVASGVSLTRRSRTRTRSKTLTGGSSGRPDNVSTKSPTSELPYLDKGLVHEPESSSLPSSPGPMSTTTIGPAAPPSSPLKVGLTDMETGSSQGQQEEDTVVVSEIPILKPDNGVSGVKTSKAAMYASTLPAIKTSIIKPPPSAFSRVPSLTRINARDSVLTQNSIVTRISTTSSSLYPPSTSTASGTDSPPSPRSMVEQDDNNDISSFDPEVEEIREFDGDDVSYRLRLLVKNNYFLPPAHSKPSPSDFASANLNAPKKPTRVTTPTFLDLFRGKSKPKPPTPNGTAPTDSLTPVLRTTSDSTTASGYAPHPQPRTSPQMPLSSPHPGNATQDRTGRVVVVREKMHDLLGAAKQAEQDMKARGVRRDQDSQRGMQDAFDDVIDPTDAVDLPPPASNYPFAVQASALHGLSVQDSVGAALLAECLPPPTSPGMSSIDPEDDAWRKALLHAAVGHSLDNSPDLSAFSTSADVSSPLTSPWHTNPPSPSPVIRAPSAKRVLGQRIINQPMIEVIDEPAPMPSRNKFTPSRTSTSKGRGRGLSTPDSHVSISRPSSYFLPLRAETPSGPQTPLAPPPRRQIIHPPHSQSQIDLPSDGQQKEDVSPPRPSTSRVIRKTMSSPMLSDSFESARLTMGMTPPPLPNLSTYSRSSSRDPVGTTSFDTSRERTVLSVATSESHYTGDEHDDDIGDVLERARRPSATLSVPTDSRPSLSDYSQPSPTASAFQDALSHDGYYSAASSHHPWRMSIDRQAQTPRESPTPRYSTMSPPPRVSSSLANIALSPPPRSTSLPRKMVVPRLSTSTRTQSPFSSEPDHSLALAASEPTVEILAPEPITPPFPISERRGNPASTPLSLSIPTGTIPVAIHSAPPPSSPTSFFDSIQTQPNAMDDLDSSDESEEEEEENDGRGPTSLFVDPRTRTISNMTATPPRMPMMRLGNHSTPYVARPMEDRRPSLPFGVVDPKKPVGNIPLRAPFFSDKRSGKSDQGHGLPASTFDFYQYTHQHPAPERGEPSSSTLDNAQRRSFTADRSVRAWQSNQRAQESLRRLDGMLIQHMETEKDTIKRIATTLHSKT